MNGTTDTAHDFYECDCEACQIERDKALDRWEAEQPEREQRAREALDTAGYYDALADARERSKAGYVQHVNRTGDNRYTVSDWRDSATVASFENGREL